MRITVRHHTRYVYSEPAAYSIQCLRLTPQAFEGQTVLDWRIEAVGIERACGFRDAFGNQAHVVTRADPHRELMVSAIGVVEAADRHGVVKGVREAVPLRVFLRHTPQTFPNEAIRALARSAQGDDRIAQLHDLMHRVRDAIAYAPGATEAHTTAAEALSTGRGVCQDHAHVFTAACRSLGIPARYVTGYFVAGGDFPAEAHHAWAEAYVDCLGWVGFDVANRLCPDDRYIRLACGLDADDAAPIRGSRRGGGPESLDVDVVVAAQTAQQ